MPINFRKNGLDEYDVPRDPKEWTTEDWLDLHEAMQAARARIGARHRGPAVVSATEVTRRAEACRELLSLTLEARQAFAFRQDKLIEWDKWPLTRWYHDEDFCRAYNTAVYWHDDSERRQALAGKMRAALEVVLAWLTNVNAYEPIQVAAAVIDALRAAAGIVRST